MRATWMILSAVLTFTALPALAQQPPKARAPAAQTQATWFGHAAWVIETPGGARIAIDPWLTNPKAPKDVKAPTQLDAILVTHAHSDHVGEAQALSKQTGAPIYGSYELVGLIGGEKDVGGNIGGTFQVKDATIHMVEAVHSSGFGDSLKTGLKYGGVAMGYVIQIEGGPTIYHAGDTATLRVPGVHLQPAQAHRGAAPDRRALHHGSRGRRGCREAAQGEDRRCPCTTAPSPCSRARPSS